MKDKYKDFQNEKNFAREITIKAIENGLLSKNTNAKDASKDLTDFYFSVLDSLIERNHN